MLAAVLAIIAQAPAPVPSSPSGVMLPVDPTTLLAGMVLLALPAVIGAINGVLSIIKHFKADPPMHKEYATKADVAHGDKTVAEDVEQLKEDLSRFRDDHHRRWEGLNVEMRSIAKHMGEVSEFMKRPSRR